MKKRLFFFIFTTVVCSCTITKRHFGNGYHVEWNRKIKTGTGWEENPKMEESESKTGFAAIIAEPDSGVPKQLIMEVPDVLKEELIDDHNTFDESVQSEEQTDMDKKIETPEIKITKKEENAEEPKRGMHPLMWGIWGMWSIAIACMFFVTFYAEALIGVALGFFIALIFALVVLRSLRKNPVKQPFKGLSYGFGIPAIVFGVIASAGLGLILVMFFFV